MYHIQLYLQIQIKNCKWLVFVEILTCFGSVKPVDRERDLHAELIKLRNNVSKSNPSPHFWPGTFEVFLKCNSSLLQSEGRLTISKHFLFVTAIFKFNPYKGIILNCTKFNGKFDGKAAVRDITRALFSLQFFFNEFSFFFCCVLGSFRLPEIQAICVTKYFLTPFKSRHAFAQHFH